MAEMATAGELIIQSSENPVNNANITSYTDKPWAQAYPSIDRLNHHTFADGVGIIHANFEPAFLPLEHDDQRRMNDVARAPNDRAWRLETEADIEHWWHTEVSDVVMAAWARYPCIVQTSHTAPLSTQNSSEFIDCTYGMYIDNMRIPVLVGEMKRNLIAEGQWRSNRLQGSQKKLARELRGLAMRCFVTCSNTLKANTDPILDTPTNLGAHRYSAGTARPC